MLRAQPEHLERVRHIGVAVRHGNILGPSLDLRPGNLDCATAYAAHQMVVMVDRLGRGRAVPRSAEPVLRLTVGSVYDVDRTRVDEHLEMPIDGGQPDAIAAAPDVCMKVLRGTKTVGGPQRAIHRITLPRRPLPAAGQHRSRCVFGSLFRRQAHIGPC
jgi:hypothetical protein